MSKDTGPGGNDPRPEATSGSQPTDAEPEITKVTVGSAEGILVLTATILASGVIFLDSSVVSVASPAIAADLGIGLSELQWVTNSYLLVLGALVLSGGALGDVFGLRRAFLAGLAGFAVATMACGLAPSGGLLIAARTVQGVFAALVTPASLAIVSTTFIGKERGRAIGLWSAISGMSVVVGPIVGGWLTDTLSWRWAFFLSVPFVAAAMLVTRRGIPPIPGSFERGASVMRALDLPGTVLVVAGLALVVGPLIEVARLSDLQVVLMVLSGIAMLGAFAWWESRTSTPMLPPHLWRIRTFSVANVFTVVVYGALYALTFLLPITLQVGFDYTATAAGAALAPLAIMLLLFSERVGALLPRVGARVLLVAGGVVCAAGTIWLGQLAGQQTAAYVSDVLLPFLVFSAGLVLIVTPVTTTALGDIPARNQGVASGTNNAVSRVGGLLAVAAVPLVAGLSVAAADEGLDPVVVRTGFDSAMYAVAALLLAGSVVAALGLTRDDGKSDDDD